MDEHRGIAELLSDAAADPPPAVFDESDIAGAARAATRRRRGAVAGSALAAVVLVGGGVAAGTALAPQGEQPQRSLAGPNGSATPRDARSGGGPSAMDLPNGPSLQGNGPGGNRDTASRCRGADGELATALAGELPSAAQPQPAAFRCPPGSRWAAFATANGTLGVLLVPPDRAAADPVHSVSPRARHVTARTASGASLYLVSEPFDGARATDTGRLQAIAVRIAGRF